MYLYEDAAKPIRQQLFKGSKNRFEKENCSFSYLNICLDFDKNGIDIFHQHIVDEYNKDDESIFNYDYDSKMRKDNV